MGESGAVEDGVPGGDGSEGAVVERGRENIMTIITEGEIYVLERCAVYCEVSGSVPLSSHYIYYLCYFIMSEHVRTNLSSQKHRLVMVR